MTAKTKYRIWEILPGASLWLTLVVVVVLSFIKPVWVIYFILVYDLYWVVRIFYFVIYLFISWSRCSRTKKVNWLAKVKEIGDYEKLYHLIILPTYKEDIKVFHDSLSGLANANYDTKKFIVILSREERAGKEYTEQFLADAEILHRDFDDKFYKFFTIIHPPCPPEELPGKGSNATWAVKKIKAEFLDQSGIPEENIIVSNFDSDTSVHAEYFARLAYLWLTADDPHHHSYQPLALYNNNIWDAPSFARVVANSTTFWHMVEKARPEKLFTFTSHSMSFKTLVNVGFWETDIVTEDSRIFWQCFNYYNGNYTVIPMYIPVSMDTVMGKNFWGTVKAQYKQMRRWAWSAEHLPWMISHFVGNKKIPLAKKKYILSQSEGQYSWATGPLFITILGRLPLWVAADRHLSLALVQNTPYILEILMTVAMVGVIVAGFINGFFLPERPPKYKKSKWILMYLQWFLMPITMIVFGSLPALDAQTRLMLGGRFRLGFDVTLKHRK